MSSVHSSNSVPAMGFWGTRRTGVVQMVIGGLLLGTLGIFLEHAHVHPVVAAWGRCFAGAAALGVWFLVTGKAGQLVLRRRSLYFALAAGVLMCTNWLLFFAAIERTSIAVATMVFHVQPLLLLAMSSLFFGQSAGPRLWAAVLLGLAGVGLMAGAWDTALGADAIHVTYLVGIALALAGAFSYTGVIAIAHRVREIPPMALAWWQCAVGSVVLAWWPLWFSVPGEASTWLWLAGMGAIPTALAYGVLYAGVAKLPVSQVALLQFVYPLSAAVFEWMAFGRSLSASQWAGALFILAALAVYRSGQGDKP